MEDKYETEIIKRFYYQYSDGTLRLATPLQKCVVGQEMGVSDSRGYKRVSVLKKKFLVHRVIYFLVHKTWPKEIDHINQNKSDNRVENLRPCNRSQNLFNVKPFSTKGVCMRGNKFRAYIKADGKHKELGLYKTLEDALSAYNKAAIFYAGEFACLN